MSNYPNLKRALREMILDQGLSPVDPCLEKSWAEAQIQLAGYTLERLAVIDEAVGSLDETSFGEYVCGDLDEAKKIGADLPEGSDWVVDKLFDSITF